jgi:hypothetical protein
MQLQEDVVPVAEARREFPGANPADDALLRHVMTTGGLWSSAAAWWVGAVLVLAGALALAWAGCPVVTDEPSRAAQRKSLSVRAGLVVFVAGMAIAALAVLLG